MSLFSKHLPWFSLGLVSLVPLVLVGPLVPGSTMWHAFPWQFFLKILIDLVCFGDSVDRCTFFAFKLNNGPINEVCFLRCLPLPGCPRLLCTPVTKFGQISTLVLVTHLVLFLDKRKSCVSAASSQTQMQLNEARKNIQRYLHSYTEVFP